jgi:hypothetical protein
MPALWHATLSIPITRFKKETEMIPVSFFCSQMGSEARSGFDRPLCSRVALWNRTSVSAMHASTLASYAEYSHHTLQKKKPRRLGFFFCFKVGSAKQSFF